MAEKRVSVRLVAEGGRQVRAELEGIGEAGTRGFGRLSSEMELANARLGSFARKAGIALAAVTAAAAAAGVAMVRSGLDVIGAQADMAASLRTTVESLQVLTWAGELAGVSMGEIEQATKKLTTRLSEAAAGSGSAVGALQRLNLTAAELQALPLDQRIVAIQEALNQFVPEAERAAVASDLFGDRAALAFLRIDSATLREAAQDVQDFGVAVSAADAAQIERTGDAIAKLSLIWLGLTNRLTAAVAPALEAAANALADMARGTGPIGGAITAVFDNLARLATYAATFAAFMAGRWVAGLAVAALSVRGLATALVFLRGALIRTGIGALIVGAGELVYQFSQLVTRVGGVGEATKPRPSVPPSGVERTVASATAAPGGCMARSAAIAAMARHTARPAPSSGARPRPVTAMAASAETVLPTTADQGCASGEFGTAKTRNAVAPSGAISKYPDATPLQASSMTRMTPQSASASPAPKAARNDSRHFGRDMAGPSARNIRRR